MSKTKNMQRMEAQSRRFKEAVEKLISDGDLNPTEAERAFERVLRSMSVESENRGD